MSNHTFAVVTRLESFSIGNGWIRLYKLYLNFHPKSSQTSMASENRLGARGFRKEAPRGTGELVAHVMFLQVTHGLPRKDVDRLAWRSFDLRTCRQKGWICIDVFKRMKVVHPMVPTCPRHLSVSLGYLSIVFQPSYQVEGNEVTQ